MSITTIIPTYKRPHLLKRAVRSVLNQTYPDFTILIADNASGPETDSVIQTLMSQDSRIKLLKQKTNIGMAANFQSAFEQVETPYVCFLPDDDFYAPTFFEEALAAFTNHPDVAFAGGGGELFINENHEILNLTSTHKQKCPETGYYAAPHALLKHFQVTSGIQLPPTLFKAACIQEVGGFDLRLKFCIDADLIAKCATRFPVYLITDRIFYFYFLNSGSLTRTFDLQQQEIEAHYLHENILECPLAAQDRATFDLWYKEWKQRIYSKFYGQYYAQKDFSKAHSYAEKLYLLTHSKRWKSRKARTKLYSRFPLFYSLYQGLNTFEKKMRRKNLNIQQPPAQTVSYSLHPDAPKWKQYALSLEG